MIKTLSICKFNSNNRDPAFSKLAGFERPILHGLCTLGNVARAIQLKFDNAQISRIVCEFASHVYPGSLIRVDLKKEGGKVLYQARCLGKLVLMGNCEFMNVSEKTSPTTSVKDKVNSVDEIRKSISRMPDEIKAKLSERVPFL